ncbi:MULTISPECIES: hypothetical protein [unclassified Pseudomonas]|uniref:hypothetical protein n=1 Tax=unclassified Pseudomonas TaxID=196821 RepID=UPI002B2272BD|nr:MULTISPECIES: hypothetical protein [unclassified Pseudomonas]MEA9979374.1 hypothetical protein [Pseudomonas sp. RTS4]MEB0199644.1 hypothetical protein [Pseudomonas sp. 5S4]MEB0248361.1 hypothetical protein [Pseudomonas sp. 10S5]
MSISDRHLLARAGVRELARYNAGPSSDAARSTTTILGIECVPSMANFLFFSTVYNAETLNQSLQRQGVILKP